METAYPAFLSSLLWVIDICGVINGRGLSFLLDLFVSHWRFSSIVCHFRFSSHASFSCHSLRTKMPIEEDFGDDVCVLPSLKGIILGSNLIGIGYLRDS